MNKPPRYSMLFFGRQVTSPTPSFLYGAIHQKFPFGCIVWAATEEAVQHAELLTFEEVGQLAGGN